MGIKRHDFAFPFRIDPGSHQARQVGYETHVAQLVHQVLLTSPGERADLPEFGCGLRAVVFAGTSAALSATVEMLVRQALKRWLSEHIAVRRVEVLPPSVTTPEENQVAVRVEYSLVAEGTIRSTEVRVV